MNFGKLLGLVSLVVMSASSAFGMGAGGSGAGLELGCKLTCVREITDVEYGSSCTIQLTPSRKRNNYPSYPGEYEREGVEYRSKWVDRCRDNKTGKLVKTVPGAARSFTCIRRGDVRDGNGLDYPDGC
jgi:hypothetical protein